MSQKWQKLYGDSLFPLSVENLGTRKEAGNINFTLVFSPCQNLEQEELSTDLFYTM